MRAKYLFLDVDEVLQSARTRSAYSHTRQGNLHDMLDPVALSFIQGQHQQGVEIVLSSVWRMQKQELFAKLAPFPFKVTPCLGKTRGHEVEFWLEHNAIKDYLYAIVDDSQDFFQSQQDSLVLVNGLEGLLYADFTKICNLLNTELYRP